LNIEIEDNGVGRRAAEKQIDFSSGRGIKIMSGIYDLYFKLYGIRIDQTIEDLFDPLGQARGTLVRIRVPLKS
jgi:hypothetical protein